MKEVRTIIKNNQALLFPVLDVLLNGFNFLMVLYLSHLLGPSGYGTYVTVVAFMSLIFIVGVSLQMYVSKLVASGVVELNNLKKMISYMLLLINGLIIVSGPIVIDYLRIDIESFVMIIVLIDIHTMLSFDRGILQGKKYFLQLNISFYFEVLTRLITTILLLALKADYKMAIGALTIGMFVSYIHGYLVNRKNISVSINSQRLANEKSKGGKVLIANVGRVILANGCVYFMSNIDILILNDRLPLLSGVYGLSSKFTDLMIAITVSVLAVLMPIASEKLKDEHAFNIFLKKTTTLMFVGLAFIAVGYYFLIPMTQQLFFSNYDLILQQIVPIQSIGTVFFGITQLLIMMAIVKDKKKHVYYLAVGVAAYMVLLNIVPANVFTFLLIDISIQFAICIAMLLLFRKRSDSMKTNLLFLSWRDVKHKKSGGAEIFTHEMLKRLDQNKYRIVHISPMSFGKDGTRNGNYEEIDNIEYRRFGNMLTVIFYAMFYYFNHRNEIDYVIDQCNTHRFFTPFWVKSDKRIFFIHQMTKEIWMMNLPKWLGRIGYYLEGVMTRIYAHSKMVLTVSNSTKMDLMAYGIPSSNIVVLPEGIDFEPWDEQKLNKKVDGLFTYVGRFSSYKGIDVAVEAFCRVYLKFPLSELRIIGKKDEAYIENVLEPIRKKYSVPSDAIIYLGFVTEEVKLLTMSQSRCLLFPSMREGWGLTVTEGAAVGTPSIVYHSPGLVDAVNNGMAGYMTSDNNVFEVQKLMEEVLMDDVSYKMKQKAAYEFSKQFNWDNTSRSFAKVI